MVKKYSRDPVIPKKGSNLVLLLACKASGKDLRIHYKNSFEVARAVRGMSLKGAQKYLKDVLAHKRCVPFTKFNGHVGRCAQATEFGYSQGRWPQKSVKVFLGLLQNLEANANVKGLDVEKLSIIHLQVNQAQKGRRRTYRAHGRINPYLNHPCHIEIFAVEKDDDVKKESSKSNAVVKLSKKQLASHKLKIGA